MRNGTDMGITVLYPENEGDIDGNLNLGLEFVLLYPSSPLNPNSIPF
jgi:hypothetical protein